MADIMSQSVVCGDTELRKLRPAELYTLGQILNVSDSWKKLMAIIPKDGTGNIPKFNAEHFSMIEQAVQQQRRNAAEIFLEEWGTMGRNRPTLRTLLDFLVKAELFRAADYVAGDLLKEELPKRPECGPAAPVDISDETIRKLLEEKAALCEAEFEESLELGSTSEINVSKVVYPPDELVNAMCDSSLDRNMQATKLDSTRAKCNEIYLDQAANTIANQKYEKSSAKVQVSDLMKFTIRDIKGTKKELPNMYAMKVETNVSPSIDFREDVLIPACIYEKQEMPSLELPTLLHEFGRNTKEIVLNQEMKTDELPVCLNNSIHQPTDAIHRSDSSFNSSQSISDLVDLSKLHINRNEIMSFELPECVLDLRSNETQSTGGNDNIKGTNKQDEVQNALASQELPITVLEYNNG